MIAHDQKKKARADEAEKERLRLEPLKEGETVQQRVRQRFLQTCQTEFGRLADMRVRGEEDWKVELHILLSNKLWPTLDTYQRKCLAQMKRDFPGIFEGPIRDLAAEKERQDNILAQKKVDSVRSRYHPSLMTPQEFEYWCRDILTQQGWAASVVGGSGDQGADVIANRAGVTLVQRGYSPDSSASGAGLSGGRRDGFRGRALLFLGLGFQDAF
ncbi:restriction endonuclease, partial [Tistrella arctica]|uniref:restriction endonuclease n=1 Tax=Tistrella arctica TaxID=3133430 RepID=UPI0031F7179B